jgi:hypothetical protein
MAMKKKPQGKFAAGKVEAPRKVTINGETHYLVYVTPEEAKGLKKAGGSGQAGPKGIPAFPRGSVSKDKVDKATGAKSSGKSTGGSNKSGGPTGGRGSEKSTPAPRDRDDRQPTPAPKSTPAPAPRDRDDRQPTPAPKSTPAPAPRNDGPSAAEKAAAAAKVKALADSKAEAEAKAVADSKAKAIADKAKAKAKAKADAEDLAMAQAVLPKVGPNPKMTTMPTVEEKLIRSIVDADIGSGVAEEKIGTQATTTTAVAPKPAPVVPRALPTGEIPFSEPTKEEMDAFFARRANNGPADQLASIYGPPGQVDPMYPGATPYQVGPQMASAMNQYGSRANNPQTVSEILMAQQSLRSLTPPPPIQSMTKIARLGTNDAGLEGDETQTAPVFTPNILDAQTDDDLGLTSSPLAGTVVIDPKVVTDPKVDTPKNTGVASVVTNTKVATGKYKPTIDSKTGAVTDRLGNPVVTNARGYGYFDPITGLAVPPEKDEVNGGGPGYGGAAFASGGGAALDTNKDNYISEAEIAAGKAKGLALEQNAISKIGTGLGVTPLGSGIDPTGLAGFADPSFIRKLGAPAYVRPDSSIAPGQKLNKWWEADKNALGFAYGTQDEISQRRADAVRAAAVPSGKRDSDRNDNGPVAPTVPTVTTPPTYTENASSPFAPIPNPNYNPADPMSLAYFTNPSYEELLAYRNSGTTPARPFAKGGIANLVKDGGNEKTIISDAIRAVEGKMSERDAAISLAKFVKAHGEPALRDLVDKVSSGEYADTRERFANGENGMVRGPGNGSGTDDKVPATIDGEQDVLLADGEMVLRKKTTDAIEKAYPGLLDRINAAEGDAPKVLAKALDFIEGRNRRG